MKGSALLLALGKPKGPPAPDEADAAGDSGDSDTSKADLGTALQELRDAATPEAMAEAFLSALELADACKGDS